jgi:hypothetical protein
MKDPIVEEIHRTRQRLLEECDGDIEKLMDRLKKMEARHKGQIVSEKEFSKRYREKTSSVSK